MSETAQAGVAPAETEETRVRDWRLSQCERLGFDDADSEELADRGDVDLHDVARLLERGATHELARRIVL